MNWRAWSKGNGRGPEKFPAPSAPQGPLLLPTLLPSPTLDGPGDEMERAGLQRNKILLRAQFVREVVDG